MSEDEAFEAFKSIRWVETKGKPVCPHCGCGESYKIRTRKIFKCKNCRKQFSVTSNTIFADRKLPIRDYLLAIAIFVNGAKGYAALQLSRDLGVSYRSAFVLAHKLREAISNHHDSGETLEGEIEVDGGFFGGHIRPANNRENRIDRRLKKYQTGKRRVVVVMRQRQGKTLPFVFKSESASVQTVFDRVSPNATVHADEATHWDVLHAKFLTKRINHQQSYSDGEACTNQAESFFSRLRRAEIGTHHHVAGKYLSAYASEMAWREDLRRTSNGEQFLLAVHAALNSPTSSSWRGYWGAKK